MCTMYLLKLQQNTPNLVREPEYHAKDDERAGMSGQES